MGKRDIVAKDGKMMVAPEFNQAVKDISDMHPSLSRVTVTRFLAVYIKDNKTWLDESGLTKLYPLQK